MRMLDIRLLTLVSLTWPTHYHHKISLPGPTHLDNDIVDVALLHVFVDIRQGSDVEGRVGQDRVHPRHAEYGEGNVETTNHQHVPVVGRTLHHHHIIKVIKIRNGHS